jgi:hypothetical protein
MIRSDPWCSRPVRPENDPQPEEYANNNYGKDANPEESHPSPAAPEKGGP